MSIYDYEGNTISSDEGKLSIAQSPSLAGNPLAINQSGNVCVDWDTFYPFVDDTDGSWYTNANLTYDQLIAQIYEPMRTAFPEYITKEVIGKDQTGTYDIYAYIFRPDYYEQAIYLQSGVHPYEAFGYIGLARLMQKIVYANPADKEASYLRYNCKIVVVPVVNVWGVMQPLSARTSTNSENVNLNRDVFDETQAETTAVKNLFTRENALTPFAFAFDYHTTVNESYGDYMATIWLDCDNRNVAMQTVYNLARKNCKKRTSAYLNRYGLSNTDLRLPYVGESTTKTTYAYWWKTLGVNGSTIEHSDNVWADSKYTADVAKICIENYATQLINHAYARLKILPVSARNVPSGEWT